MDPQFIQLVSGLGPTAGAVAVVWLFIRFLSNHMGTQTRAMNSICATLAALKTSIERCPRRD